MCVYVQLAIACTCTEATLINKIYFKKQNHHNNHVKALVNSKPVHPPLPVVCSGSFPLKHRHHILSDVFFSFPLNQLKLNVCCALVLLSAQLLWVLCAVDLTKGISAGGPVQSARPTPIR